MIITSTNPGTVSVADQAYQAVPPTSQSLPSVFDIFGGPFIPPATTSGSVPSYAALYALNSSAYEEGDQVYVQSGKARFMLVATNATPRTNIRVPAQGAFGFMWVRIVERNPAWEAQAKFVVDPQNITGNASDDNNGGNGQALLSWTELSLRLAHADVGLGGPTVVDYLSSQQVGDDPMWTYNPRGTGSFVVNGVPSVVYQSTVTSFSAAPYGGAGVVSNGNILTDAAVPGGSFTAAGALGQQMFLRRMNGLQIYASVVKDTGGAACRTSQPVNPANLSSLVGFQAGDTYQLVFVPQISSWNSRMTANLGTTFQLVDWNEAANAASVIPGAQFNMCYIQKVLRSGGPSWNAVGCCFDIPGGASFESGSPTAVGIHQCSFKGTGATRYAFSGHINSEATVETLQGATLLVENGHWNLGGLAIFDTTSAAFFTGTGGSAQFLGSLYGSGNTSKLLKATNASQINSSFPVADGQLFAALMTSDNLPIQTSASSSAGQILLDANMNGVFQS